MMTQHQTKEVCVWGKFRSCPVEVKFWILTKKNKPTLCGTLILMTRHYEMTEQLCILPMGFSFCSHAGV